MLRHDKTKTTDRNDLKLGTIVVLDTVSKATAFRLRVNEKSAQRDANTARWL